MSSQTSGTVSGRVPFRTLTNQQLASRANASRPVSCAAAKITSAPEVIYGANGPPRCVSVTLPPGAVVTHRTGAPPVISWPQYLQRSRRHAEATLVASSAFAHADPKACAQVHLHRRRQDHGAGRIPVVYETRPATSSGSRSPPTTYVRHDIPVRSSASSSPGFPRRVVPPTGPMSSLNEQPSARGSNTAPVEPVTASGGPAGGVAIVDAIGNEQAASTARPARSSPARGAGEMQLSRQGVELLQRPQRHRSISIGKENIPPSSQLPLQAASSREQTSRSARITAPLSVATLNRGAGVARRAFASPLWTDPCIDVGLHSTDAWTRHGSRDHARFSKLAMNPVMQMDHHDDRAVIWVDDATTGATRQQQQGGQPHARAHEVGTNALETERRRHHSNDHQLQQQRVASGGPSYSTPADAACGVDGSAVRQVPFPVYTGPISVVAAATSAVHGSAETMPVGGIGCTEVIPRADPPRSCGEAGRYSGSSGGGSCSTNCSSSSSTSGTHSGRSGVEDDQPTHRRRHHHHRYRRPCTADCEPQQVANEDHAEAHPQTDTHHPHHHHHHHCHRRHHHHHRLASGHHLQCDVDRPAPVRVDGLQSAGDVVAAAAALALRPSEPSSQTLDGYNLHGHNQQHQHRHNRSKQHRMHHHEVHPQRLQQPHVQITLQSASASAASPSPSARRPLTRSPPHATDPSSVAPTSSSSSVAAALSSAPKKRPTSSTRRVRLSIPADGPAVGLLHPAFTSRVAHASDPSNSPSPSSQHPQQQQRQEHQTQFRPSTARPMEPQRSMSVSAARPSQQSTVRMALTRPVLAMTQAQQALLHAAPRRLSVTPSPSPSPRLWGRPSAFASGPVQVHRTIALKSPFLPPDVQRSGSGSGGGPSAIDLETRHAAGGVGGAISLASSRSRVAAVGMTSISTASLAREGPPLSASRARSVAATHTTAAPAARTHYKLDAYTTAEGEPSRDPDAIVMCVPVWSTRIAMRGNENDTDAHRPRRRGHAAHLHAYAHSPPLRRTSAAEAGAAAASSVCITQPLHGGNAEYCASAAQIAKERLPAARTGSEEATSLGIADKAGAAAAPSAIAVSGILSGTQIHPVLGNTGEIGGVAVLPARPPHPPPIRVGHGSTGAAFDGLPAAFDAAVAAVRCAAAIAARRVGEAATSASSAFA